MGKAPWAASLIQLSITVTVASSLLVVNCYHPGTITLGSHAHHRYQQALFCDHVSCQPWPAEEATTTIPKDAYALPPSSLLMALVKHVYTGCSYVM